MYIYLSWLILATFSVILVELKGDVSMLLDYSIHPKYGMWPALAYFSSAQTQQH